MRGHRVTRRGRVVRRGVTIVEAAISMLIVGLMMVAALNTVAASGVRQHRAADKSRARFLAQDLMAEIVQQPYADADEVLEAIGPNAGELTRAAFNDVDDYHGFTESPPRYRDATPIPGLDNWERRVSVQWVSPATPGTSSIFPTGVKRITVQVFHRGNLVAESVSLRTYVR